MKKVVYLSIVILLLFISSMIIFNKKDTKVNNNKEEKYLCMYLETEANTGKYELSNNDNFPTDGYRFNEEKSKCDNNVKLTYDEENKMVIVPASVSGKCNVYFDINLHIHDYYIISEEWTENCDSITVTFGCHNDEKEEYSVTAQAGEWIQILAASIGQDGLKRRHAEVVFDGETYFFIKDEIIPQLPLPSRPDPDIPL